TRGREVTPAPVLLQPRSGVRWEPTAPAVIQRQQPDWFSAPEGRKSVAHGASGIRDSEGNGFSPGGGVRAPAGPALLRPSGAEPILGWGAGHPRLAPWATIFRPSGAQDTAARGAGLTRRRPGAVLAPFRPLRRSVTTPSSCR